MYKCQKVSKLYLKFLYLIKLFQVARNVIEVYFKNKSILKLEIQGRPM